jgi:putative flavoprotein involved in K+ transport
MREPAIVIGAGPAGLATAAMLRRRGLEALVLERGAEVGAAWRGRCDSLRLHTVRQLSSLPGTPEAAGRYPGRDAFVGYLER